MIDFHTPTLEDRSWIDPLYFSAGHRGCEYSFTNTFCWKDSYLQQVARINDYVAQFLHGPEGDCYPFPVGQGDLKPVIDALMEDAQHRNIPFRLICVTPEDMAELDRIYPDTFAYIEDRHGWDYLYDINKLADLAGKKMQKKRNHIHRFEEAHPDWTAEEITDANLAECLEMDMDWSRLEYGEEKEEDDLNADGRAIRLAIRYYHRLELEGILIRSEGKVLGFSMGRRICADTCDVNFEKSYADIQGAYPIVNREFARYIRSKYPDVAYLNREDDMGVEGLRKAKLSYYPDLMVEKHSAVLKAQN